MTSNQAQWRKPEFKLFTTLTFCLLLTLNSTSVVAFSNNPFPEVNLRDFGAVGDGEADDGPALQSALDALAAAGGGTLFVPAGSYALVTPVVKNFSEAAGSIAIRGEPSSTAIVVAGNGLGLDLTSEFIIKVGQTNNAITIIGLDNLLIKDILFSGVQGVLTDARITINLSHIHNAEIQHSEFYGIATLVGGGAIVYAFESGLTVSETAFLGCAGNSGMYTPIVQNVRWRRIKVSDSKFVDYGNRSDFYSKTPLAPPSAWVSIGNASHLNPLSSRREAFIQNAFMDEGAVSGISALPYKYDSVPTAPFDVFLSRIRMNVSNLNASGVYLLDAQRVFIERSHFGWSHRADSAINLVNVGEAVLDLVECVAAAHTIRADASTQKLTLINSTYEHLDSAAQITKVITTQEPLDDPPQYVRHQYLNILDREPAPLPHYYWTTEFLSCEENLDCINEKQFDLATFLDSDPPPKISVAGMVSDEEGLPLAGITVVLTGSRSIVTETDSSGSFIFADLATAGTYIITPAMRHYSFESLNLTNPVVNQEANFFAALNRWSISGRVLNENGDTVPGATISLSGSESGVTTSDADGNYLFSDLPAGGNYTVSVSRQHYQFANATFGITDLSSNEQKTFTGTRGNYVIAGSVRILGEGGLSGVTINLEGSQLDVKSTNHNGEFSFSVPAEGSYIVRAFMKHYTFSPHSIEVHTITSNHEVSFLVERNAMTNESSEIDRDNGIPQTAVTLQPSSAQINTQRILILPAIILERSESERTKLKAPREESDRLPRRSRVHRSLRKSAKQRAIAEFELR